MKMAEGKCKVHDYGMGDVSIDIVYLVLSRSATCSVHLC